MGASDEIFDFRSTSESSVDYANSDDLEEDLPFAGSKKGYAELLRPKKTIQLAASGPVMINEVERRIIDTPDFQRLRGVRQLGAAYLVYPTALHTRFDHSLGTLQMAEEMMWAIRRNQHSDPTERHISKRQEALARLYALLHDVTHVPFGHSIEDELGLLERHDHNETRIERFLGQQSQIGRIIVEEFGSELHRLLLAIYRWDENPERCDFLPKDAFIHDLVSNTVCADLLDYLRRDDFFCNLGVGMRYHFLNYLYLEREETTGLTRVFVRLWKREQQVPRRDLLSDLCRLLDARYMMAERVYFHHAKVAAGAMLGRAIQEHADTLNGEPILEHWICAQSDDTLVAQLKGSKNETAARLAKAVNERTLYECIAEYGPTQVDSAQASTHGENVPNHIRNSVTKGKERRELENLLAEILVVRPGDVLIYAPARKMNLKEADMRVRWKGNQCALKMVDDPVVEKRLAAIIDAHGKLWAMRLLAVRTLTPQQRELAHDFMDAELMTLDSGEREMKRRNLCSRIISERLEADDRPQSSSPKIHRQRVAHAADELLLSYHNASKFSDLLQQVINQNFPKVV